MKCFIHNMYIVISEIIYSEYRFNSRQSAYISSSIYDQDKEK